MEGTTMRYIITVKLLLQFSAIVINLAAQDMKIEAYVYDVYTGNPIESALVSILWNGTGIDSTYTDGNGIARIAITTTSVKKENKSPTSISLSNNYPNPFEDNTNVNISIPNSQTINASIYNLLGQRVASEQIVLFSGNHTLNLSMGHLPKGVYFLRIDGNTSQAIKLIKIGRNIQYSGSLFSFLQNNHSYNDMLKNVLVDEYTLKATKKRYEVFETSLTLPSNTEITVPLIPNEEHTNGIVIDIDGNIYHTVKIGNQLWMAENLRVKHYRNGDPIHNLMHTHIQWGTCPDHQGNYRGFTYSDEFETTRVNPNTGERGCDSCFGFNYAPYVGQSTKELNEPGHPLNGQQLLYNRWLYHTTEGAFSNAPPHYLYPKLSGTLTSPEEVLEMYGALYNWYAVDDPRGLCPAGWHVPSDDEWKEMEIFLGMPELEANSKGNRGHNVIDPVTGVQGVGNMLKSGGIWPEHPGWLKATSAHHPMNNSGLGFNSGPVVHHHARLTLGGSNPDGHDGYGEYKGNVVSQPSSNQIVANLPNIEVAPWSNYFAGVGAPGAFTVINETKGQSRSITGSSSQGNHNHLFNLESSVSWDEDDQLTVWAIASGGNIWYYFFDFLVSAYVGTATWIWTSTTGTDFRRDWVHPNSSDKSWYQPSAWYRLLWSDGGDDRVRGVQRNNAFDKRSLMVVRCVKD
jgi:hypothetical protein